MIDAGPFFQLTSIHFKEDKTAQRCTMSTTGIADLHNT